MKKRTAPRKMSDKQTVPRKMSETPTNQTKMSEKLTNLRKMSEKQTDPRKDVSLRKAAVVVEPTSSEQHSAEKKTF